MWKAWGETGVKISLGDGIQFGILLVLIWTVKAQTAAIDTAKQALQQNTLATVYSLSQSAHAFLDANPGLIVHFDKNFRGCRSDEDLRNEYENADVETQGKIKLGCEKIADFMQVAFTQRELFPDGDWNTWWAYFCDAHDESPKLRDFLKDRDTWYEFTPILSDKKRRKEFFR